MRTVAAAVLWIAICVSSSSAFASEGAITPCKEYPRYWCYGGRPVLLLGGSIEDNLFQIPELREHLDLLKTSGGNYVRNTMSSRDDGNVWPFHRIPDGRYDLEKLDEEYWNRFESLLKLAKERDIIVQIELWDRFDFALEFWQSNPYNPKNNINYTSKTSELATSYPEHPGSNQNPFFRTIPELENNTVVYRFQKAQVDKMLSISLKYPNVLYCMDNETSADEKWGAHWAKYLHQQAADAGVKIYTTEMWDPWDLSDEMHRRTFAHPSIYPFADISQNNHKKGQSHWDNAQEQRAKIASQPRPLNNVKIYGADGGRYGSTQDGLERFWRNVVGGMASARFHRPDSGLGLTKTAQLHLRSARTLTDAMNIFRCEPDNRLLLDRSENEAYLTCEPNEQYLIYFPDGGEVRLDLTEAEGHYAARWFNIELSQWSDKQIVAAGSPLTFKSEGDGHWAVLLLRQDN